mmetsp:Transcript_14858/g.41160  ORF Transcript_14858/g.41160 Transcript_14858/m.41160 type:complete len:203 (-) Transcript_14858:209-817(-)
MGHATSDSGFQTRVDDRTAIGGIEVIHPRAGIGDLDIIRSDDGLHLGVKCRLVHLALAEEGCVDGHATGEALRSSRAAHGTIWRFRQGGELALEDGVAQKDLIEHSVVRPDELCRRSEDPSERTRDVAAELWVGAARHRSLVGLEDLGVTVHSACAGPDDGVIYCALLCDLRGVKENVALTVGIPGVVGVAVCGTNMMVTIR